MVHGTSGARKGELVVGGDGPDPVILMPKGKV